VAGVELLIDDTPDTCVVDGRVDGNTGGDFPAVDILTRSRVALPVQGVVFDCDGTLLDSMGVWHVAEEQLASRAGIMLDRELIDKLASCSLPEVSSIFHTRFGLGSDSRDVEGMFEEIVVDFYAHQAQARPGALACVQTLFDQGIPCSVASSTPHDWLEVGLSHAGLLDLVCAVVSVDDVGRSKRYPDVYHRARELMGTSFDGTWVVEDSAYALRTLAVAGYHRIGIYDCDVSGTYGQLLRCSDLVVRNFAELSRHLSY
jgi:beta-phosphoglucomutase-like phosphatase (HAD superfamily)